MTDPAPRSRDELLADARATKRAIDRVRRDRRLREGKAKPRTGREWQLFGSHLRDPAGARALEDAELRAAIRAVNTPAATPPTGHCPT